MDPSQLYRSEHYKTDEDSLIEKKEQKSYRLNYNEITQANHVRMKRLIEIHNTPRYTLAQYEKDFRRHKEIVRNHEQWFLYQRFGILPGKKKKDVPSLEALKKEIQFLYEQFEQLYKKMKQSKSLSTLQRVSSERLEKVMKKKPQIQDEKWLKEERRNMQQLEEQKKSLYTRFEKLIKKLEKVQYLSMLKVERCFLYESFELLERKVKEHSNPSGLRL